MNPETLFIPIPHFDASLIPDQSGKVVIITGGNSGIGRASAEQLCKNKSKMIIITSTSQASADNAAIEIQNQYCHNSSKIIGKELKLEDHISVKNFAEFFISLNEPLHILMLNAGLASVKEGKTSLGLDLTVGINWFGHFYLQHLLQDILEKSAPSRVIIISSGAHARSPIIDLPLDKYILAEKIPQNNFGIYSIAKLFNILHANELHRRLRQKGIKNVHVLSVHPGLVKTNFLPRMVGRQNDFSFTENDILTHFTQENYQTPAYILKILRYLSVNFGLSPLEGALSQLYAATSPEIEEKEYSGGYIVPIARYVEPNGSIFAFYSSQARNETLAKSLWDFGESLIPK